MVRHYVRKSNRSNYSSQKLEEAINDVRSGRKNAYNASKKYGIPLSTLLDRLKGRRGAKSKSLGRSTALSKRDEMRLASGLLTMEKYGFGLSRKEVLELTGQYVQTNKIKNPFRNGVPGEDWFLAFAKRNNLSIKKPQSVEIARKRSCNPFTIDAYFTLLEKTIADLGLEEAPSRIWNLDESSFCTDPSKTKVVGGRNLPCTRTTSAPGRENITVLLAASAAGDKIPPLIIFKGKNIWDQWQAPENTGFPNTTYAATSNGWMETEVFENYFEKSFLKFIGPERPVLLIYDGHATHLSIKLIETASESNVAILKLPPHTSHILQPLDLSVFKPLKTSWDQQLVKWQRQHLGKKLPKREFSKIVGEIWLNLDVQIIMNGFKKGGIFPFCRNVVPESMYDASCIQRFRESSRTAEKVSELSQASTVECNSPINALIEEAAEQPFIFLEDPENYFLNPVLEAFPEDLDISDVNVTTTETETDIPTTSTTTAQETPTSFEELLLHTLNTRNETPTKKKKKLASGAEVITAEDAKQRMRSEKEEKEISTMSEKSKLKGKKKVSKSFGKPTITSEPSCSKEKNDNLCSICCCDFRYYVDKKEWIRCISCMQ